MKDGDSPRGHSLLVLFVSLSFCFVTVLAARTFLNKLFFNVIFGLLNVSSVGWLELAVMVDRREGLAVGPLEMLPGEDGCTEPCSTACCRCE